jgi:hypothetical protein
MKVIVAQPVEIALRTLGQDDRQKVQTWLGHLQNWEQDAFVRSRSHKLQSPDNVYVLRTSTDVRIFFTLDGDTITVLDVARRDAIMTSGHPSGLGKS